MKFITVIQVQEGASNFKINNYNKNDNGKYGRDKTNLKASYPPNSCEELTFSKLVNPCEKNFWQVNIEGKEYISDAEFGWHYKDKDCLSYTFDELPQFGGPGTVEPTPSRPSVPSVPSVPSFPSPSQNDGSPTVSPTIKAPSPSSMKSKGKADGKAMKKTEDGEWEYVRRRRRG